MHDVPAVAAAVARHEARERAGGAAPADEFEHDRGGDESGEGVREQARRRAAEAESEEHDSSCDRHGRRHDEGLPERPERRAPPGDERADPHQEQERQPEAVQKEVVVRLRNRARLAVHGLRQQRIHHAPEDRERERDEQQVVVQERRLARNE